MRKKREIKTSPLSSRRIESPSINREVLRIGRNETCPCGSGKKYKACHLTDGKVYIKKIAQRIESERIKEERKRLRAEGVPWFRRMFA
jgi:hypothetical protein